MHQSDCRLHTSEHTPLSPYQMNSLITSFQPDPQIAKASPVLSDLRESMNEGQYKKNMWTLCWGPSQGLGKSLYKWRSLNLKFHLFYWKLLHLWAGDTAFYFLILLLIFTFLSGFPLLFTFCSSNVFKIS